jgi:hypothetical protein
MLTQVFAKFAELLERMENRATQNVVFDPVDLEAEIERMEARLSDLQEALVESREQKEDAVTKQQKAIAEMGRRNLRRPKEVPQEVPQEAAPQRPQEPSKAQEPQASPPQPPAPQEPPAAPQAPPPSPPQKRQRVMPDQATTQERQERPPEPPQQPQQPEYHPLDPRQHRLTETEDSFFDPGDPDAEQAIAAEGIRQERLRSQHQERLRLQKEHNEKMQEAGMDPNQPPLQQRQAPVRAAARVDSRTGGLRSAANTSRQVFDTNANSVTRPPQQTQAKIGGVPVFRREAEVIENRGRGESPQQQAQDNVSINPEAGSANPRFRGPGQQ